MAALRPDDPDELDAYQRTAMYAWEEWAAAIRRLGRALAAALGISVPPG